MSTSFFPRARDARRLLLLVGGLAVGAVVAAVFLVWYVFFSTLAPAAADIDRAIAVLDSSPSATAVAAPASPAASAPPSPVATVDGDASAATGTDGTWSVDTSIGSFDDYSSSWVGFRVAEVLDNIGSTEAVGRTPTVSGSLSIEGTTLSAAVFEVDLTAIQSDQSRRDPAIQRALETGAYPMATFEVTNAVDLGALPTAGQTSAVTVTGVLTIHGVPRQVEAELQVTMVDGVVVVVGSLPLTFADYGVEMPTAPVVVSVEDNGTLEWQLFLTQVA